MNEETHVLTWSSNRGRYCSDDPERGHDLTCGEPVSIEVLRNVWVDGHIEHAGGYDGAGCYNIHDAGRPHPGTAAACTSRVPLTQERLQQLVGAVMQKGTSLADALDAATGNVSALYRGYYFLSVDGHILGLCTGMRVRTRDFFSPHAG